MRRLIRRQYTLIAATLILCLAVAVVYLLTTTRLYRATARFTAEPMSSSPSESGAETRTNGNFFRTQSERISSRSILALALSNPELQSLRTLPHGSNRLAVLHDAMTTDIGRLDDVISVSVQSPYPTEAPLIANAIVDAYRQYQSRPAHSNAADVISVYEQQAEKLRAELDTKLTKMQAMEQQYGVLSSSSDPHNNIAMSRLATLSQELTAAQLDALKAKSDLDEARKTLPTDATQPASAGQASDSKPGIVSAEQEDKLRSDMIDLQSRREELRQRYLPSHPALLAIAQQIDDLNRAYVAAVQQRVLVTQKRTQDLQNSVDSEQKQLIGMSARTAEYERLSADADRLRKAEANFESRADAIQAAREAVGVHVDFFDPAQAAVPSHPRPISTLAMTLLLGLMLGTGVAWLRDWADDRLHSSDEIRTATGLAILGAVPQMPRTMSLTVAAQKVCLDPSSLVAQAYRSLQSAVDSSAPRGRARTIVVTSLEPDEGKTTSAANLAIAMAQRGRRVLLMDAVMQEPKMHSVLGVSSSIGLSTLLSGQADNPERAIRRTSVEGLWVLPAGDRSYNPTELLNSPAFPELLEQVADDYDHVVIDSPALNSSHDARIIAASCDLTLLVMRADTATRRGSILARDGLLGVGANLLGIILTRVPGESRPDVSVRGAGRRSIAAEAEADLIDLGSSLS